MDLTRNRPCQALLQLSRNTQPIPQVTVLDPNTRKPDETVKQWESRMRKRLKEVINEDHPQPQNLFQCKRLYDQLLQVDPEAYIPEKPLTEEEQRFEQEFFDKPEIEEAEFQHELSQREIDESATQDYASSEAGPGPQTQAHRESQVSGLPIPDMNLRVDSKGGFLDLDIWPVPYPDNKEHRVIWQNGIRTAKDMFKVDGAEYAFSTWFTEVKDIDLASIRGWFKKF